jgi:hypothetical protein
MIDSEPPSASCAWKVSSCEPNCSAAPKPRLSAIAAPTPIQTGGSLSLRSVLTR